jgi:hypothetical protein
VRVTEGIRTQAFKQARLAMGAGLGGLVAKTAVPYNTPNYFSHSRFEHTVDEIVRAEGPIAIQGAPSGQPGMAGCAGAVGHRLA